MWALETESCAVVFSLTNYLNKQKPEHWLLFNYISGSSNFWAIEGNFPKSKPGGIPSHNQLTD